MPADPATLEPLLVPTPRRLDRRPGHAALPPGTGPASVVPLLSRFVDGAVPAPRWLTLRVTGASCGMKATALQGYSLRISVSGAVTIESPTHAGVRNGLNSLIQLLRQYGPRPPVLEIIDTPAFATRGVMLDVSRDRVPTMAEFRGIIDSLAGLKFNHLQLYTEHTFAYAGHEEVWRGWSPITPDEARELDAYCSARGIELAANQNCFGHLAAWLRHPRYARLAETHGDWKFYDWTRSGPFSLCPGDPGSIALVEDWLGQLLPCFASGWCNINADETFDVGQGRSKEDVAERGRAAVYFDFISKVCDAVRRHGKRPMFWADIALSLEKQGHAESIGLIPRDLLCLAWGYEPESPFGHWCDLLRNAGRETWVCPGTSSWRSTTGRTAERRANLDRAGREGLHHDATGFLVTDWGDLGHTQQWPVSLHGLVEAAQVSWNGAVCGPDCLPHFHAAESLHGFDDRSLRTGEWLDRFGNVDRPLRDCWTTAPQGHHVRLNNATALFTDFRLPWRSDPRPGSIDDWHAAGERADQLARQTPAGLPSCTADELEHALDVARVSIARGAARRASESPSAVDRHRFEDGLRRIMETHARLWARRSRPGGLDNSQKHYQHILDDLATA